MLLLIATDAKDAIKKRLAWPNWNAPDVRDPQRAGSHREENSDGIHGFIHVNPRVSGVAVLHEKRYLTYEDLGRKLRM